MEKEEEGNVDGERGIVRGVGGKDGSQGVDEGSIPPLMSPRVSDLKPVSTNQVQKLLLKVLPTSPSNKQSVQPRLAPALSNRRNSHMRLVQTPDGKKFLLTNVVSVSKTVPNKQLLLVTNDQSSTSSTANTTTTIPSTISSVVSPKVSTKTPQTIILNTTVPQTTQPIVLRISGISQPVLLRQQNTDVKTTTTSANHPTTTSTTTTTAVQGPITSPTATASPPFMMMQNGAKFKVVGKPMPIKLFPKAPKIAPKTMPSVAQTTTASLRRLRKGTEVSPPPLTAPLKPSPIAPAKAPPFTAPAKTPPLSTAPPKAPPPSISLPTLPAPPKTPLPTPPAYLNIRVKEEPKQENEGTAVVKSEPVENDLDEESDLPLRMDDMLDVRIKEEATDEQSELLARDEQLRKVLGVTNTLEQEQQEPHLSQTQSQQPKFYIRTSEGKLVSISSDEAKLIGLNHQDKVENNQKKLMQAFSTIQSAVVNRDHTVGEEIAAKLQLQTTKILIPQNADVKEFVSCHVSPAAEKTATIMRKLAGRRLGANSILAPKSNAAILGEFEGEDGRKYLKIMIETEANGREPCNVPISPVNTYQCPFCGRDFKTKDHVVSHIRIHTGERPYPCDVCGKRYRQRIDIIRHMRIHTGEKPFNCGLCNASFNQKSNLRSHMRIHTGERPVQCNVCGKGFSRNTHLKQHMKLHTGEKPYQCKVCDRPFRFKSGLQAHERIHTGLKPYACSLCGRTFTQIVGLIRHERTHAGEKPFRCQSCGKSFDTREALKSHIKKHTGERPHSCDLCSKTFTDSTALRCHRKKYHNNMLVCVICLQDDFKDRIELREHLRAHERLNWEETPDGELVPLPRANQSHFISVNDTLDDDVEEEENEMANDGMMNLMEVELDPDDPLEEENGETNNNQSDFEVQAIQADPLA